MTQSMKKTYWPVFAVLMIALGLSILSTRWARAAGPFSVNTAADTHDAAVGNGVCADANGQCSLRAAIEEANSSSITTTATINVPANTYNLTLGELAIAPNGNRTIFINGAGSGSTIIHQSDGINRVINIDFSSIGKTNITLNAVSISGGTDKVDALGGAGILAGSVSATPRDSLTLTNCILDDNHVSPLNAAYTQQPGGGLYMAGGDLTVTNCTFSNNSSASSQGGAIAYISPEIGGTVLITGSTFTGNSLTNTTASGPVGGGAIYINSSNTAPNTVTVSDSTFNNNSAFGSSSGTSVGGAILFNTGVVNIDHSTFTNNITSGPGGQGGAIYVDSGTLNLSFSRLKGNTAANGGSGLYNHTLNTAITNAANNWWGCNSGPTAAGCDLAATENNTGLTFAPWIILSNKAEPSTINVNQTSTVTASFLQNSAGQVLTIGQVSVLLGLPVSWSNDIGGSLTSVQTTIQPNGQATAIFSPGSVDGTGHVNAVVDNGTAAASITILSFADIAVNKTSPATALAGGNLNYTITVSNNGPSAAQALTLKDILPPGITFISQDQTDGSNLFTLSHTGNTITNTIATLPSGASATFSILTSVSPTLKGGTGLANTASISSTNSDPISENNASSAFATVNISPTITSANHTLFTIGKPGSFTIIADGFPAPSLVISGTLPAGVNFLDNGGGSATLAGTPALGTVNVYPITLIAHNGSGVVASQPFTLTVQKAPSSISIVTSPNPSVFGQTVTFNAAVTSGVGTPTGSVQFSVDGANFGSAASLSGGDATLTTGLLGVGTHSVTATYTGDANFDISNTSLAISQVVNQIQTETALEVVLSTDLFKRNASLTAIVAPVVPGAGMPTGTVTFMDGSTTLATVTLDASGKASLNMPSIARGSHTFRAFYNGSTNYSTSSVTMTYLAPYILALPIFQE